jgi:hypothetical protein
MEGFSLWRRDKLDLDATWIFRVERVVPRTCGIGVFLIVHGAESSRPDLLDHFINMSPRPSMKGPVIEPDSIPIEPGPSMLFWGLNKAEVGALELVAHTFRPS